MLFWGGAIGGCFGEGVIGVLFGEGFMRGLSLGRGL